MFSYIAGGYGSAGNCDFSFQFFGAHIKFLSNFVVVDILAK